MMKMLPIALSAAALAAAAPCITQGQSNVAKPAPSKSGHLAVNGLNYYYEDPRHRRAACCSLHGGLGSIDMFRPMLPALADGRRVIAVDLHGHGRTALGDRQIDLPDMGDDMAGDHEETRPSESRRAGLFPWAVGVALRFAVQHPEMVRRLALVSAGMRRTDSTPRCWPMQAQVGAGMAEQMKGTPMYESYVAVAPKPCGFPEAARSDGAVDAQAL